MTSMGPVRRASKHLGVALSIVGLVFIARVLAIYWPDVREAIRGIAPAWCLIALVAATSGMTIMAIGWRLVLDCLQVRMPVRQVVSIYFRGEASKYVPGAVWTLLGRAELTRRFGVSPSSAYASVFLSLATLWTACALVAGAFLLASRRVQLGAVILGVALVGLLAVHPRLTRFAFRFGSPVREAPTIRWGQISRAVLFYVPAWLCVGTASWALANALHADVAWSQLMWATATAWLAGFLAVPVPGGIGVRESIFVAMLSTEPAGVMAAIALLSRILFVFVDGVGAVGFWAVAIENREAPGYEDATK